MLSSPSKLSLSSSEALLVLFELSELLDSASFRATARAASAAALADSGAMKARRAGSLAALALRLVCISLMLAALTVAVTAEAPASAAMNNAFVIEA